MTQPISQSSEAARLIALSKVRGADVYNTEGHHIGTIDTVVFHKARGSVDHVVLAVGRVLGFGGGTARLDWHALKYDRNLRGYVTGEVVPALQAAPEDAEEVEPAAAMPGARLA